MSNSPSFLEQLSGTPLFREFTEDELQTFLGLLDAAQTSAGACIVRQDEPGDSMYLLVSGRARVVHHAEGRDIALAELAPGDFFGEIGLVDQGPRSADVEAISDCSLLIVSQASISALAGVYPAAAFKFLIAVGRILVLRMRQSNRRYIDSLLFPVTGRD